MAQVFPNAILLHPTGRRKAAVVVAGKAAAGLHPVVDHGVARAGIECQQLARRPDPGDIGNAADVDDHHGLGLPHQQRRVIGRRQGRPLTAGRHIGGAQVIDDVDAGRPRQASTIAKLHGDAALGGVQHGVAVQANDIDARRRQPAGVQKSLDRLGMQLRELSFQRAKI